MIKDSEYRRQTFIEARGRFAAVETCRLLCQAPESLHECVFRAAKESSPSRRDSKVWEKSLSQTSPRECSGRVTFPGRMEDKTQPQPSKSFLSVSNNTRSVARMTDKYGADRCLVLKPTRWDYADLESQPTKGRKATSGNR